MNIVFSTIMFLVFAVLILLPFENHFLQKIKINLFKYGIPVKKKTITFSSEASSAIEHVENCLREKKFIIESKGNVFLFHNIGDDVSMGYNFLWGTVSLKNDDELIVRVKAPVKCFQKLISSTMLLIAGIILTIQMATSVLVFLSCIFLLSVLFSTRFLMGSALAKTKIEEAERVLEEIENAVK